MYAALTELEQWLTAASNWLTGAALVISLPLAAVYIGCMAEAIRELHARGPEIEKLYLDSKILPGELRALVMVSNCLEREFIHRQLATGQPLHMNVL